MVSIAKVGVDSKSADKIPQRKLTDLGELLRGHSLIRSRFQLASVKKHEVR